MSEIFPVIDAHCHVFPDKIAEKSKISVRDFYELPMYTSGTAEHLKNERNNIIEIDGRKFQIVKQLICSPAVVPHQTESINHFISGLVEEDSAFVGFGTLHPENENFSEILAGFRDMYLYGLKVHSDFQQFNIDEPNMYPVYEECTRLKMPVLYHMGDKKLDFSHPRRLAKVLQDIPDLIAVAAHMGGYSHWKEALEVLQPSERLYFDISSTLQFIDGDLLKQFMNRFGTEHFFFGSDFPMWNPETELRTLLSFGFSEEELHALLYSNYQKFLHEIGAE